MTNTTIEGFKERCQQVLEMAKGLHSKTPNWVTFFRETLGVDGAARSIFALQDEYLQFEKTDEYETIQSMINDLRSKKPKKAANEDTKVITVRLPESLHEALKAEAAEYRTSMNKLCISKLLQALVEESENAAKAADAANRAASNGEATSSPTSFSMEPRPVDKGSGFRSTLDANHRANG